MSPVQSPPQQVNGSLVQCVGHSLMTGYALDDLSLRTSAKLAGMLGSAQEWNQAIAGATLGWVDADSVGNPGAISWLANRIRRYIRLAPYTAASDVVIIQQGKNDMNNVGQTSFNNAVATAQGLAIFQSALKTAITLFRSSTRRYLGATGASSGLLTWDSSITLPAGVWTAVPNPAQVKQVKGLGNVCGSDGYRTTPTTSAQVSIAIPTDYPGSAVCPLYVMFVADPNLTAGTITASGAATGTFNLKTGDYGGSLGAGVLGTADSTATPKRRGLVVWRFTGAAIAAGGGTLTLTCGALTGGVWGFAEWGIEAEVPPIVAITDISKDGILGVGASVAYSVSCTDAAVATWNTGIQTVINEFRAKDNYTIYTPLDSIIGGTGGGGARGTLNGGITAGSPANGGTLAVTSTTGAWPTSGTLGVGQPIEYISWTGSSGNPSVSLTGIKRGDYGSTPAAFSTASVVGQFLDPTKIKNFAFDQVHWSEEAQSLAAQEIYQKIRPLLRDVRRTAHTVGPGRVDARLNIGSLMSVQVIPPNTQTLVMFDTQNIDTANQHEPSGSAGVQPNTRVVVRSDGVYDLKSHIYFVQGKSMASGQVSAGGVRYVGIRRNGAVIGYNMSYPLFKEQNVYLGTGITVVVPDQELRAGDYIEVVAFANISGASTTLSVAQASTAANVTFTFATTNGFYDDDFVKIDSEIMRIGTILSSTTVNMIARGQMGTTAAAHNSTGVAISNGWEVGKTSTLNGALTNVATSVPVAAANFLTGDYVRVDDEMMQVTAGSLTTTLTVTRGVNGSSAVSHLTAAPIYSGVGLGLLPATLLPNAAPVLSVTRLQAI